MSFRGKGRFGGSGGGGGEEYPVKREGLKHEGSYGPSGSGGGERRFDRKRAYEQTEADGGGGDYKKLYNTANEFEIDLITNAFPIRTDPKRFGALHIFKVAFDGPRQVGTSSCIID